MVAPANYMPGWSYIFYSPHPLTVVGQVFSGASVPSSSSIDCFLSLHLLSPPLIAFSFLSGPTHQSNIYHIYASILAYLLKHANVGAFLCRRNGPKSTMGQCAAQSLFGHPPPTHPYEFQLTHQRKVLFLSNRSLEPFCKSLETSMFGHTQLKHQRGNIFLSYLTPSLEYCCFCQIQL